LEASIVQVRHNTTLLEQAIALVVQRASIPTQQAEAEALAKRSRAIAHGRVATGAAIALAAVGLGLGVMLGFWKPIHPANIPPAPPSPQEKPSGDKNAPFPAPLPLNIPPNKPDDHPTVPRQQDSHDVIVNFTKFANQKVDFLGKSWDIQAGHQYAAESDKIWTSAWCYTRPTVDGVALWIDLASRPSPSAQPLALIATRESLAKAGLDDSAALALATKCPWLDEKSSVLMISRFRTSDSAPFQRPHLHSL
jgi:hypothetical protein